MPGELLISPTEVASREQGGSFSDAASADVVADTFAGMRHVDPVELNRWIATQRQV